MLDKSAIKFTSAYLQKSLEYIYSYTYMKITRCQGNRANQCPVHYRSPTHITKQLPLFLYSSLHSQSNRIEGQSPFRLHDNQNLRKFKMCHSNRRGHVMDEFLYKLLIQNSLTVTLSAMVEFPTVSNAVYHSMVYKVGKRL